MKTLIPSDLEIANEALQILMRHMPTSKVARLVASLGFNNAEYSKLQKELFAAETVDSLFNAAIATPPDPS